MSLWFITCSLKNNIPGRPLVKCGSWKSINETFGGEMIMGNFPLPHLQFCHLHFSWAATQSPETEPNLYQISRSWLRFNPRILGNPSHTSRPKIPPQLLLNCHGCSCCTTSETHRTPFWKTLGWTQRDPWHRGYCGDCGKPCRMCKWIFVTEREWLLPIVMAEVLKIGNLSECLVVLTHGWQKKNLLMDRVWFARLVFHLSIYLSVYLPIYLSIYLSFYLFFYLSVYLSLYLT